MKHSQAHAIVFSAANQAATEKGYEVVEVDVTDKLPSRIVITIYHPDGVKIDDCAAISHDIDDMIDGEDLFEGQYTLEVQSPGLDRPIQTKDDYRRNKGQKVEVHLYKKINDQKEFIGILTDYGDETVDIRTEDGKIVTFDSKSISLMRQVIEF